MTNRTIIRNAIETIHGRKEVAKANFLTTLCEMGGIAPVEAERVWTTYKRVKVLRWDGSRYTVTHGAFLDRAQIRHSAGIAGA